MCARFLTPAQRDAERYWAIAQPQWHYEQSWKVLPTDSVPVVVTTQGQRRGTMMRWGLVPFRNHGVPPKLPLINARIENLATGYWNQPWQRGQRCILSMAGFYEPHLNDDGSKDPYCIRLVDREIFGVAGLWERSIRADGSELYSCTLITQPANRVMSEIHNEKKRMPAVLAEADHEAWLKGTMTEAGAALRPYPDDLMVAWRVSRRVNDMKTNDASLVEPAD